MDGTFKGAAPVLYHCNGDFYSAEGYTPQRPPYTPATRSILPPMGAVACDGAFPYYRVLFEDWGFTLAIGWPAQWAARFNGLADGVQVRAGSGKDKPAAAAGRKHPHAAHDRAGLGGR